MELSRALCAMDIILATVDAITAVVAVVKPSDALYAVA